MSRLQRYSMKLDEMDQQMQMTADDQGEYVDADEAEYVIEELRRRVLELEANKWG